MKPSLPPPEAILKEVCRRRFPEFVAQTMILSELAEGTAADWVPFTLWPAQQDVAQRFQDNRLIVCLKARQLGLTWLALAFGLWHLILHPTATVLLFSRRDDESTDLLQRMKWMYDRLPPWLKTSAVLCDNAREWQLGNGSRALAFPTTAGDSYTGTLAIVDEADLIPDLDSLLRAVKPTTDAKGRLVLISRADKKEPESPFKRIYRAAAAGETDWHPVFLPWNARPDRDAAWYDRQRRDIEARTGSLDDLAEQYPSSDAEALAPRTLDKRLPPAWLSQCYEPRLPVLLSRGAPAINGLTVYALPVAGRRYAVGADPAEGNPTSDPSAVEVMDVDTGEEVAALAGRFEPSVFAAHVATVARWFNRAPTLVERNNHGHAVLLWLRDNAPDLRLLCGDDLRTGWQTTSKSKALAYDRTGEVLRDAETVIHSLETFHQLGSIEGGTLRAPEGQHDDIAVAYVLALNGRARLLRIDAASTSQGSGPTVLIGGREDPYGPDFHTNPPPTGALGHGAERLPPWITGGRTDPYGPG